MQWIRTSTPPDAKFLIDSFSWLGDAYAPSDGGVWIPYLAGRTTSFLTAPPANSSSLSEWAATEEITYVYFGERSGVLDRADFAAEPERYALVYDVQGIQIYRVIK